MMGGKRVCLVSVWISGRLVFQDPGQLRHWQGAELDGSSVLAEWIKQRAVARKALANARKAQKIQDTHTVNHDLSLRDLLACCLNRYPSPV